MRVLITGGAGFIGSHLADACIERGDEVVVLDDFSTGRIANVERLLSHRRFRLVRGDVANAALVGKLLDDCEAVYHVAARLGMRLVIEHPLSALHSNVAGTEVVLEQAAARRRRVLFTSTSEIYGLNEHKPSRESDLVVLGATSKSRWSYAYSKAMGEVMAMAYHHERGLPVVIARLFNTVGARQTGRYGMVVPTFVRQALAGEPITVHGDGSQSRCFVDVGEVVRGLVALMEHPAAVGEIFNLGSRQEITIRALAERVKAITGTSSEITFVPHDVAYEPGFDEIRRRVPDISKARGLIGFEPRTPIETIIGNVVAEQRWSAAAV